MKTACSLLFFSLVLSGAAQSYEPVKSGKLYGYSVEGRPTIPAAFQYATHFREGLALVKQNDKWGYIDSTGAWVVPPEFDNAEPFAGTTAFVYRNRKTGVIDRQGKLLAEPLYDTVRRTDNGIEIVKNGRKGLVSEKYGVIPPEYTDFSFVYSSDYLYAQRGAKDFDLYLNGAVLLKGLGHDYHYQDLISGFGLLKVSVAGKEGVLSRSGEWIVPPKYDTIAYITVRGEEAWSPGHDTKGNGQLLLLTEVRRSEDAEPVSVYYLARMDGSLVSEEPFGTATVIVHNYYEHLPDELHLLQDGKIVVLNPDMTLQRTPYVSIIDYNGWKICDDGEQTHLFDPNGREVLVSDDITVPESANLYDRYENPIGTAPFVHVAEQRDGELYHAVYHLGERQVMTSWMREKIYVSVMDMRDQQRLFVFYYAPTQRYAWYFSETGTVVPFEYAELTQYDMDFFGARKEHQDWEIYACKPYHIPQQLVSAPTADISSDLAEALYYLDEETGEILVIYENVFTQPFLYFRDAAGKYGLVAGNHTVVPAQYDSLAASPGSPDFVIAVQKNDKWGAVDLRNGDRFEPFFDSPPSFASEWPNVVCTAMPEEGYYLTISGKKLWSLSGEYSLFKENGKVGLKAYPDFENEDGAEERVVVVPAMYKSIAQNDDGFTDRFLAKGTNGKYGIIDVFNDTIVPFVYSSIVNDFENDFYGDEATMFYVRTFGGKKTGLADIVNGAQIPARFDECSLLFDSFGNRLGFRTTLDGKSGLYSSELTEVLPCSYDALFSSSSLSDDNLIFVQKNGRWRVVRGRSAYDILPRKLEREQEYDLIIDSSAYVKTASGYDRYELQTGRRLATGLQSPDLSVWDSDYRLFLENGLIGVTDAKGKILLKPASTFISLADESTVGYVSEGELYFYSLSRKKRYSADQW